MDEQDIARKKELASEKKPSMKRRDDYHDYSERRMYMITIEVTDREPVLGRVDGDPSAATGSGLEAHCVLSPLGQAVAQEWIGIPRYYPQVEVRGLQVMPDHLHGILFVQERLATHLGHIIGGFKTGCNRVLRAMRAEQQIGKAMAEPQKGKATAEPLPTEKAEPLPTEKEPLPTGKEKKELLPTEKEKAFQQVAAQPQLLGSLDGSARPLFARGYNDLILRSYEEYQRWKHYLEDNPRRLLMKRARPEWLRPFFGFRFGGLTLSCLGNRELLERPRLMVRISRRVTGPLLEETVAQYLAAAERGTVLVSPAISPGEKLVMRTAFDRGFPTIVVLPKGFSPLSKPKGEQFDACSEGRLLLVSTEPFSNEKVVLTKPICEKLNLTALALAESNP